MEKNPLILRGSRKDDPVEKRLIEEGIKEYETEGALMVRGEQEKSLEEKEKIDMVNGYLHEIFENLDLVYEPISYERVHFLSKKIFEDLFAGSNMGVDLDGVNSSLQKAVFINKELSVSDPKLRSFYEFSTLLHETIHFQSKVKRVADTDEVTIRPYRVGYHLINNPNDQWFVGFNEGIVSHAENNILAAHSKEIADTLGLTEKDIDDAPLTTYLQNMDLVVILANKISGVRSEKPDESFTRLLDEQFTGNMMHLREIEKIYGKGSLRLLARYGSEQDPRLDDLIFRYFEEEDIQNRILHLKTIQAYDGKNARISQDERREAAE